jgi:hypothetical protein
MYNNLINVERYLGQQKNARALREEARRLYPEDRRFSSVPMPVMTAGSASQRQLSFLRILRVS